MKKVKFILMSLLILVLTTTVVSAQVMYLTKGVWEDNNKGCACQGAYGDCICGIGSYLNTLVARPLAGKVGVVLSSQILLGSTLQIKFNKIEMKLRSNDFIQKQEVPVDAKIANSLGWQSIIIQPGTYTITGGNTLKLNVRCLHKLALDTTDSSHPGKRR